MSIETLPDDRPLVALIAGPTASGKSSLALSLAESRDGIIINADASQVYRDLRLLSARPSREEERRAEHRLFGHLDRKSVVEGKVVSVRLNLGGRLYIKKNITTQDKLT